MENISIAIHGGAGTILKGSMTPAKEGAYRTALQNALDQGYQQLDQGSTAVEAVARAVTELEDSPLFNAGRGSVFTAQGMHEMDASVMDGKSLNAGAVSAISGVKNPILLARLVMEKSEHVFLTGKGAEEFARDMKCTFCEAEYFYDELRYQQWQELRGTDAFKLDHSKKDERKFGTVGAVALDKFGNIAAATSTGGMTNKKFGRVGDSPMIGAGNYATQVLIPAFAAADATLQTLVSNGGMSSVHHGRQSIWNRRRC